MAIESSFNFIDDLVDTNPAAGDNVSEGDNHLRGIKEAVQGSFPSLGSAAVTSTAAELNLVDGVTAFLDDDTMAADSATSFCSQQSIKAYVDNKLATTSVKIVEIGTWDMDADASTLVAHGLTHTDIRNISALISKDDGTSYVDFGILNGSESTTHGIILNNTNVTLHRGTGGLFDNTAYDSTGINRGWITIIYAD